LRLFAAISIAGFRFIRLFFPFVLFVSSVVNVFFKAGPLLRR